MTVGLQLTAVGCSHHSLHYEGIRGMRLSFTALQFKNAVI
jgi:hypothetical protein